MPSTRPGARGAGPKVGHQGGPGGSRPGARGSRSRSPAARQGQPAGARALIADTGERRTTRPPRLTGRAAILVLVLAVLTVSYASSMRAYLQQRSYIGDLKSRIAEREQSINDLEREKRRWQDPAYVRAQARERFGYLMPGETGFEVIGPDGEPLEPQARLKDPDEVIRTMPTAWWTDAWDSVELAGNPPAPIPQAPDLVDGTKAGGGSE